MDKARDDEKQLQQAIRKARSAVVAARRKSRKLGTQAAAGAYEKSQLALQRAITRGNAAGAKVTAARVRVNQERLAMSAEKRLEALQERLANRKETMNRQAEKAIVEALSKYEVRWRKRRAKSDQKKLRLYGQQLKRKMKAAQTKEAKRISASSKKGRRKRKAA